MTYSCTDFTDDMLNKLVNAGLIKAEDVPCDDPEYQSRLAIGAVDSMLERIETLTDMLRLATTSGGIGEHEFSRPGGWREKALRLIDSNAPVLHLYFVSADDEDGNNADLLTRAPDAKTAVKHWKSCFSDSNIPAEPKWIGIVPTAQSEGPVAWNDIRTLRGETEAD